MAGDLVARLEITCVSHVDPGEEPLAGVGAGGRWWTTDQVVTAIASGSDEFYVEVAGTLAEVRVVDGALRAAGASGPRDLLSSLPPCPGRTPTR